MTTQPDRLREALEGWVPQHSSACAAQDDDDECICGTSAVYEAALAVALAEAAPAPDLLAAVEAFPGILGWSNKRPGVEFYHSWDEGRWARRDSRYDDSAEPERGGWGRLLADDIEKGPAGAEGRAVVVLVAPDRSMSADAVLALLRSVPASREAGPASPSDTKEYQE